MYMSVESAFAVCATFETPVTIASMAEYAGVTERCMRERIKELKGQFWIKIALLARPKRKYGKLYFLGFLLEAENYLYISKRSVHLRSRVWERLSRRLSPLRNVNKRIFQIGGTYEFFHSNETTDCYRSGEDTITV